MSAKGYSTRARIKNLGNSIAALVVERDALQRRVNALANTEQTLLRVGTELDAARLHIVEQRNALQAADQKVKAAEQAEARARERAETLTQTVTTLSIVSTALAMKTMNLAPKVPS